MITQCETVTSPFIPVIIDCAGAGRALQPETGAGGTCEAVLRAWLFGLDSFRKKILSATLLTFDVPLTALCYLPCHDGWYQNEGPSTRIHTIPGLLLFEMVVRTHGSYHSDTPGAEQHFLAVAATDSVTLRRVFAVEGGQVVLLPLTPEIVDLIVQAGD